MRRVLGIEIIVLASPPPILIVRRRDFQDLDPRLLNEAEQASAIAAGRTRCRRAAAHRMIASSRASAGSLGGSWQNISFREQGHVRRRPPQHAGPYGYPRRRRRGGFHLPRSRVASWFDRASTASPRPSAWTGQLRDQTVRPFSGHRHRRGKTSPRGVPGRPTGPRKDTNGRSECGSGRTGTTRGANLPNGPSL